MEEDSGAGDGNHHQPKKSKMSADHDGSQPPEGPTATGAAELSPEKQLLLSSSSTTSSSSSSSAVAEQVEGDVKMMEQTVECPSDGAMGQSVDGPEDSEPTKMSVEDETSSPPVENHAVTSAAEEATAGNASGSSEQRNGAEIPADSIAEPPEAEAAAPSAVAPAEAAPASRNATARPRNRFRGRNYRLRSDSSGSEREGDRAEDDTSNDPDVEAMIRRLVDEMNQEGERDDDERSVRSLGDDMENDDANDNDDNSTDTSSPDSDDSDSSPAVSADDDDDDDDDDSDNDDGSDNNANEQVDVATLPFMQTANVKCNWNYFREIQLRSLGLTYRTKTSLGGLRYNANQFQSRAYGSKHVVERLAMLHRLREHGGCVNSLNFNAAGTLLASGSDDLKINLWNWQTNKLVVKPISSGHRANVFQTKFVEASGYRDEIEIISTGRDGQVRHTRVGPAGENKRSLLFKQSQPIHKIAIPARSPYEFLTACEDGVVKGFDLRDNVGKKVTNVKKRLYSISTHPLDNEFCVSGNDEAVRVYDRRNPAKPMKYHYADHMKSKKEYLTVTCAVYNTTGTEILASYSDEDIFLFDNVKHEDGTYLHKYSGHCNMKTIKGVNFFGPQSEFVVSGSDCGNIFFWDKESEIIVNWMKGDDAGVVNCLEPHPEFPIMATSGLDHDAKIWVPKGTDDEQEAPIFAREALEKCVRRNIRIRQTSRCPSFSEDRILDFLMFSRQGIGGRLRRHFSSDSEDQADGDGNGGAGGGGGAGAGGGRRSGGGGGAGDEDDDDNRMILRCNPS